MQIPDNAEKIINALCENGFDSYVVGGCVRDFLLGKPVSDTDIATSALPIETEKILRSKHIKVIETGIKHGTVTAVIDKTPYEITTFRTDGEYMDSRRPESVEFVQDIKEDLKRRDFTVNAMAYNESAGLIDLFGGKDDLKDRIIRAVGDPDKRFKEDALRIMRALRFSAVLGFEIEENTKKALFENRFLLKNIAAERILTELLKLLVGKNVLHVLDEYREVIAVVIPELRDTFHCAQNTPWHMYTVYEHIIRAVAFAPPDSVIRLTMLLHDIGKPSVKQTDENGRDHFKTHAAAGERIAETVLRRLKVSNEIFSKVTTLIKYHQSVENVNDIKIKRWFNKIGQEYTLSLFEVRIADLKAHNTKKAEVHAEIQTLERLKEEALALIRRGDPYRVCDLAVNGNDLMALGFSGRDIGDKLQEILALVLEDKLKNEKSEILSYLSQ
ncbi:MAG TPA: CCA tRNA nucleotidyltransferase [Candidatus Eubacterium faecavium]|nr:CCA tRNA nucleotidyltransferase [Candidatus Eubacterium faecavium]